MAIKVEQRKKDKAVWPIVAVIIVVVAVLAGAIYYVFFAPVPALEVIAPPPLRTAKEIAQIKVDPTSVIESQAFKNLRNYAPLPTIGQIGRVNPFINY